MSHFNLTKSESQGFGRLGTITTGSGIIQTPSLFPVVAFIGGSTPNCGGLWKYVRKYIFETGLPILSEITHFLNFNVSPNNIFKWREKTFHKWFEEFKSPLFLDSGGFQLLNNKEFDLERYGLTVSPKDILNLQLEFGGEMIATLDYPLPPTLKNAEAERRINFTISNAITTLRLLEERGDNTTRVYVPIHGRTASEITTFVNKFVKQYKLSGLERKYDGFAVGSLVPLRSNPEKIIEILIAVKTTLRKKNLSHLPIHVFGVGSTLIPHLVYLGFDTFDNSTYVQQARSLKYADPDTWAYQRATQLKEIKCNCVTCQKIDVKEMIDVLTSEISFQPINGKFKSEFYAHIATHNLNVHLEALNKAKEAFANNCLEDYLIEFTKKRVSKGYTLEYLANNFDSLKKKVGARNIPVRSIQRPKSQVSSLNYKPKDFTIPNKYRIPDRHKILFLFPCSKEKPYSTSQTFKRIFAAVKSSLNGTTKKIHFVVISGLYGPVPLEYDSLPETTNYDFVLTFRNHAGVERVAERISEYLTSYGENFEYIVACAPSKPYRKAIEKGLNNNKNASVFPTKKPKRIIGKSGQFYQALEECVNFLKGIEDNINTHETL